MPLKINLSFVYTRERKNFGRYPNFKAEGPFMLYNVPPNEELRETHIRLKPLTQGTQIDKLWGLHQIETDRVPQKRRNENHYEGGWPKEINLTDMAMTSRFIKKLEKEESLLALLPELHERSYTWLIQNSAMDVYDPFDRDYEEREGLGNMTCRKMNIFKDQSDEVRPCCALTFTADGRRFASAYDDMYFQRSTITDTASYLWSLENPNDVEMVLDAGTPASCLEFSPRDCFSLAGGVRTGQIAFWDIRRGSFPVRMTPFYDSYREPVMCLKWLNTKTGMDIFAGAGDGQIMWWDLRNMSYPVEVLLADLSKTDELTIHNAFGVTCLEYEPTIPTKFMLGTENGLVISGNKKGKTMQEKLQTVFMAHKGPVKNVQRNPYYTKNFLSCGDYTVKIWTEDFKESCILWSKFAPAPLTSAAWSPIRYPSFFTIRKDGVFEAWDLIERTNEPTLTFQASSKELTSMCVHFNGNLVAVGTSNGSIVLLELSKHFTICDRMDKNILAQILEREARREKLLEGKLREMRLKKAGVGDRGEGDGIGNVDYEAALQAAENYFHNGIKEFELTGKITTKQAYVDYD